MTHRVLIIIASKDFRDEELNIPLNFFKEKNFNVTIAAEKTGKAKGEKGTTVEVFYSINMLTPEDYDLIILVGGKGSEIFWKNKELHSFLKKANKKNKIIAASYKSPVSLAYAGILKNKRATVWIEDKDILDELGAYFTGSSIEIDGNIVTTDGPHSTKMFVKELYDLITKNNEN